MTARRPDPAPAAVSQSTFASRTAAPSPPGIPRARRLADKVDAPTVIVVVSNPDIVRRIES